jgi:AcrR family transcriptional regulator
MEVNRPRTQADRSAATKDALVRAARPLFAARGFGGVGTEAIVRAAGVTRGAMYHQFADKTELFAAVFEAVEEDVSQRIAQSIVASGETDPIKLMELGAHAWIDACADPEVQRIVLIEAPAVLGWERWREIGMRYGVGLVEGLVAHAISVGRIPEQPVKPLAHVFIGAVDEAALYVVRAEDQATAREEMRAVVSRLVAAMAI